jgi:neutral ceramidase
VLALLLAAGAAQAGPLRAGAVRIDITPPDLTALNPMGGSFKARARSDLPACAGARRWPQQGRPGLRRPDRGRQHGRIRQRIERELGIAADHVIISASHNHSAPRLGRVTPGALAHDGGPESDAYTAWVYDRMVAALGQAGRPCGRRASAAAAAGST